MQQDLATYLWTNHSNHLFNTRYQIRDPPNPHQFHFALTRRTIGLSLGTF
jgi:hypothetical protein